MSKSKPPTDKRGSRTKRNPRAPSPEHKKSSWAPLDDLHGDSDGAVDEEMELDTGKYERPIPKP
ncbi:MAG TPA: hypothetical protein VIV11_17390 [Kofleriaceae bacterium]